MIAKARKGHRRSQTELYKLFYSYVISVALRYSSNRDEAMEITHDAFVKMFTHLDKYQTDQAFKPWLRKITVNAAIDHFRKYKGMPNHLEVLENDARINNDALVSMEVEEIMKLITMLSPAYRMVFSLYVVEGFNHQEIAERLEISIGTSKSNLAKARMRLQQLVEKHYQSQNRSHGQF